MSGVQEDGPETPEIYIVCILQEVAWAVMIIASSDCAGRRIRWETA